MSIEPQAFDIEAERAHIVRAQEEVRAFAAEQNKLTAEALTLARERRLTPVVVHLYGLTAGAALLGAGAALAKLFGH